MKIKTLYAIGVFIMAMIFMPSCARQPANPALTVSILPQKYLLERIVGDKYEVECLLAQGGNPESYEPEMAHLVALERCKAYFSVGTIPFEKALLARMQENAPDVKVINTSAEISLLKGTHSGIGHSHGHACNHEVDPHVWTSVVNAKCIAHSMYESMIELDAANADCYTANYDALCASLDSLHSAIADKLQAKKGSAFAVWHPSLSYYARDYGLMQIAMEIEGKEVPANKLKESIERAGSQGVKVIFFQKEFDNRQVLNINEALGAKMVEINPMSYDWVGEMIKITDALATE